MEHAFIISIAILVVTNIILFFSLGLYKEKQKEYLDKIIELNNLITEKPEPTDREKRQRLARHRRMYRR